MTSSLFLLLDYPPHLNPLSRKNEKATSDHRDRKAAFSVVLVGAGGSIGQERIQEFLLVVFRHGPAFGGEALVVGFPHFMAEVIVLTEQFVLRFLSVCMDDAVDGDGAGAAFLVGRISNGVPVDVVLLAGEQFP